MIGDSLGELLPLFEKIVDHIGQVSDGELVREHHLLGRLDYGFGVFKVEKPFVDEHIENIHFDLVLYHLLSLDVPADDSTHFS